ncbi:putative bifunctional diguanylate cyclase/phosphodiesterase [Oceanisphaera avium]|uniref:GGDEF domain-containing protein n=1 Tax=Oceanisphaera avium TaxID=1903694 RepID=A0A1Y0D0H4_9GAMM|nr:EAL domain-containing protein [Oceanisphaera avium]ART80606.1 hypothetical protein CBP12_11020 [Oceanisphaera avium]
MLVIIHLLKHSILLLAMCWLLTLVARNWALNDKATKSINGTLFGLAAVAAMMTAIELESGWIFDARSVILSVAALMGGPLVAAISLIIAGCYRIWIGGAGQTGGVLVIVLSAGIGLAYYYLYRHAKVKKAWYSLLAFGFLVHLGVVGTYLLLPNPNLGPMAVTVGLPMLVVMPFATLALTWMLEEIKSRSHYERELLIAATAFEVQAGLIVTDEKIAILRVNPAFSEISGFHTAELIGKDTSFLRCEQQPSQVYEEIRTHLIETGRWQGEMQSRRKNGDSYPAWVGISVVRDQKGKVSNYVASVEDMTEFKATQAKLHGLTFSDSLTHLPNRSLLLKRMQHAIDGALYKGNYVALLLLDIDGFKSINDLHGRKVGDQMLCQLANRLNEAIYPGDTAARIGADQFVIMMENLSQHRQVAADRAEHYALRIKQNLEQVYSIDELALQRGISIGITLFNDANEQADTLLQEAEMALHQAKASFTQDIHFFDLAMQEAASARIRLEEDIQRGISAHEFIPHFQPQFNHTGKVIGAEALARWQHPEQGLLAPFAFIEVAEQAGLVDLIDLQMLEQACCQLAQWQAQPSSAELVLAVNLSARLLYQPHFVDTLQRFLTQTGADAHYLKLELTETMLLDDMEKAVIRMQALRVLGIRFSIDDFGTGYSSLSYLQKLPLSQLKIDQSFVRELTEEQTSSVAIIKAICALANSLQLAVIAEGVETQAQYQKLLGLGCQHFQGYLFARPMAINDFTALLEEQAAPLAVQI